MPTINLKTLARRYPLWTMNWSKDVAKARMKNPVLIAGLPGIGNVGKIVVDLLIESMNAKKLVSFFSDELPHSVFVQETGLVALPGLALYAARASGKDYLFLAGDVQPMTERSSYQLAGLVLDLFESYSGKEIVTLGGIGLPTLPQSPRLYVTGHDAKAVLHFSKDLALHRNLYGVVGPIIGISGILVGLSARRRIPAYCILAETLANPLHLGLISA